MAQEVSTHVDLRFAQFRYVWGIFGEIAFMSYSSADTSGSDLAQPVCLAADVPISSIFWIEVWIREDGWLVDDGWLAMFKWRVFCSESHWRRREMRGGTAQVKLQNSAPDPTEACCVAPWGSVADDSHWLLVMWQWSYWWDFLCIYCAFSMFNAS